MHKVHRAHQNSVAAAGGQAPRPEDGCGGAEQEAGPDTLWVGGIPQNHARGSEERAQESLAELFSCFGHVMATTVSQKLDKPSGSWGYVKYRLHPVVVRA
eukprot:COSAG01_NODE_9461_length_2441_cov_1.419300_2_plen_100_part_00